MSSIKFISLLTFIAICQHVNASTGYESYTVLADNAVPVTGTPEFFWELECKRIALEFVPEEKRLVPPLPTAKMTEEEVLSDIRVDFTTAMDLRDFKAALQDGSIKPIDPNEALEAHVKARAVVNVSNSIRTDTQLPEEAPGEFAMYHLGALAHKTKRTDEAAAAWSAILSKPAGERKYRSTWASYMLGRLALDTADYAKAAVFFQDTRKLAKEGCFDSLGLAAESYGWEARCELELGHSEASARFYLNQLAAGDPSAAVSLKWFIPNWALNVKGVDGVNPGVVTPVAGEEVSQMGKGPIYSPPGGEKALVDAAHSPLLRRLVTAHILATTTGPDFYRVSTEHASQQAQWLKALDEASVNETPDAEYIGWVAYSAGKYEDAKRWLAKSSGNTTAALWLQAKFALRDGEITEGTKLLSKAIRVYPLPHAKLENSIYTYSFHGVAESVCGELGVLYLAQSDFIQALDAFLTADFWEDAAYVAERCLTKAELLNYTRKEKFQISISKKSAREEGAWPNVLERFRDLVARRMVREKDYAVAKEFFTPEKIKILDDYTTALTNGMDVSKPIAEQARALFHAAWIARYKGMELMGTEIGPDSAMSDGSFNDGDLAMARLTGKKPIIEDSDRETDTKSVMIKFPLPVTQKEKNRLEATKLVAELRFHYRHVAAGLAWQAAGLLSDHLPETADVLNSAGNWLKGRHDQQARRFFNALVKRCPQTEIGKQAIVKDWFVETDGLWSAEERKLLTVE